MPVTTTHPEYDAALTKWQLVRDCIAGSTAVKERTTTYLPAPDPTNTTPENAERYRQYIERAVFMPVTKRTRYGLLGNVFRRDPKWELPAAIEELAENVDGAGQSVIQLSKWVVGELLAVGRVGLLVDYPMLERPVTRAQARLMGLRPQVLGYATESILNWRYGLLPNGQRGLTLLVLLESADISTDEFEVKTEAQYRVLRIDEAGNCTVQLYDAKGQPKTDPIYPRRGDGNAWREIPFVLSGAETNQEGVDDAPLYTMADVNIAHYRNSADYEEGVYMHGQGTMFVSVGEMTLDDFTKSNPEGIKVGARRGHILGNGGSADLLQTSANSAAFEAMQHKEEQMVAIGARIITKQGSAKTAEEVRLNAAGESSTLDTLVGNASEGIEKALELAAVYENADPDTVLFSLNRDFFGGAYDPQAAMAKMQELDRKLIAKKDYRDWLRGNDGLDPDRKDEDIDEEAENEQPDLPPLDEDPPALPVGDEEVA